MNIKEEKIETKKNIIEPVEKDSNEIGFWFLIATFLLMAIMPIPINLINPVNANGPPSGCGPERYTYLGTTPYLWSPLLIAHAPFKGTGVANNGWAGTTSFYIFPVGGGSSYTSNEHTETSDGKTTGVFKAAKWDIYEYSRLYCGGENYAVPIAWDDSIITQWLYGNSQTTDADDITSFYHSPYDSIYFDHRYHECDFAVDTRSGGSYEYTAGGSQNMFCSVDISISVSDGDSGFSVSTGVFSVKASSSNSWDYKYTFPSGHLWYVDNLGGMLASKYIASGGGGGGGGGSGCPFIAPWNGRIFKPENNLLLLSESATNNDDVEDWYLIKQLSPIRNDYYSFQIQEFENEETYLDCIKLFTVDHPRQYKVGVSYSGEIIPYKRPISPLTAIDSKGKNIKSLINRETDGKYLERDKGESLLLDFGLIEGNAAKLVMNTDRKQQSLVINVNNGQGWKEVIHIHPRRNWAVDIVDLDTYLINPLEKFLVRIDFTDTHKIDYIGLEERDISPSVNYIQEAPLKLAFHPIYENLTETLLDIDADYAFLSPGYDISTQFYIPEKIPGMQRDLIFYSYGRYYTQIGEI